MRAEKTIPVRMTKEDRETWEELAKADRRRATDMIRNMLEDLVEGAIEIEIPEKDQHVVFNIRASEELKAKVDEYKSRSKVSIEKAAHLALEKLRGSNDAHLDYQEGITADRRAPKNQVHEERAVYRADRQ
jgi:hypothetical protein